MSTTDGEVTCPACEGRAWTSQDGWCGTCEGSGFVTPEETPDWRLIAKSLYDAIGQLDDVMPGGIGMNIADHRIPLLQPAIDAYEEATDP